MIKIITLTLSILLTSICVFGQITKTTDTTHMQIRSCRATTYFIDGFKVHSNITKNDSLKILKETAKELNGYWKSTSNSDIARFIISSKSLSGQMLLPYEKVQQAPPTPIKLTFNKLGIVSLITPTNELRMRVNDNELTLEENTFRRQK